MSDDRVDIKPKGLSYQGEGIRDGTAQRHELKFSQAATLADLSEEYEFFTLALVYTQVNLMGRDPWGDYVGEGGRDDVFQITMRFDKPIFKGLEVGPDREWNHVLWCMEKEEWKEYCQWMGRVAFTDRDRDTVTRLRTQQIRIADPLYFDRAVVLPADPPTTVVTVFWLDSNQGVTYMRPGVHPVMDIPWVVHTRPGFRDTIVWGRALLNNNPDPYAHVETVMDVDPVAELAERVRKARENEG